MGEVTSSSLVQTTISGENMKLLFISILVVSSFAEAVTLKCQSLINLDVVSSATVATVKNQKIQISSTTEVVSYVTELGPELFLVEAFLPELEMRIYAQGTLHSESETLTASVWARSMMVDVICFRSK